jgi:hypothetical protein
MKLSKTLHGMNLQDMAIDASRKAAEGATKESASAVRRKLSKAENEIGRREKD